MKLSLALLAVIPTAFAHFVLQYPQSLGFDEDQLATGPCGGYAIPAPLVSNANSTNVTVDAFAIALQTTHPQSQWLYRATISTEAPYNWTNLLPVVMQSSIGEFCLPNMKAPAGFAGKTGVIQVVGSATDGLLYQCAVVNFVTGANTTKGAGCTNATGLVASITTQTNITNSSTTTSATPSATSHSAASAVMQTSGFLSVALAVVGAVFML